MDWLFFASIVGHHPLCGFGVEDRIQSKLAQSCLYVTWCGCAVASENVSPVTLAVYEQVLLSQLHKCISDAGITVRVVLHGLTHDVGNLVVLAIIHAFHGVQNTALYRFQAIFDSGYCTLQYHIRSIVQEPVLVHACQMLFH